ncbi:MAG: riboflavin biosynthesis protein RibF [bacterium]|nr:MAG: riboflavin biosynthesis protein RibF [bacterium]
MKIIRDASLVSDRQFTESIVTIGVFDGVHIGHQDVIGRAWEIKKEIEARQSIILTFDRHPMSVTHPEAVPPLLTTLDEKLTLLEKLPGDRIIVEHFSSEIARIDYHEYIARMLIERLGMVHLVVGYDFHLGRGREGSQERLVTEGAASGFGVTIVPPVVLSGRAVSSTKIRRAVLERRLDRVRRYLGRPYFFDADVVRGKALGRTVGFPTANVAVRAREKLMPPHGVYAVCVDLAEGSFNGMMNIGVAPTLHDDEQRRIEVHLLDFSGDLYDRRMRIHCIEFIREEKKFESADALTEQLMHDRQKVLMILEKKH